MLSLRLSLSFKNWAKVIWNEIFHAVALKSTTCIAQHTNFLPLIHNSFSFKIRCHKNGKFHQNCDICKYLSWTSDIWVIVTSSCISCLKKKKFQIIHFSSLMSVWEKWLWKRVSEYRTICLVSPSFPVNIQCQPCHIGPPSLISHWNVPFTRNVKSLSPPILFSRNSFVFSWLEVCKQFVVLPKINRDWLYLSLMSCV